MASRECTSLDEGLQIGVKVRQSDKVGHGGTVTAHFCGNCLLCKTEFFHHP